MKSTQIIGAKKRKPITLPNMNCKIKEKVELPEPGIANRIMDAIIYGDKGNEFGGSNLATDSRETDAF